MHLIVLASKKIRSDLDRALHRLRLHYAERADSLQKILRNLGAHGVLIVCSDIEDEDAAALGIVAKYRSTPVIFVGELTTGTSRLISVLGRSGNPYVCLKRYDAAEAIEEFLLSYSPGRELARFHAGLLPALGRLPEEVRQPFERMLFDLRGSNPVEELAARAGRTTREIRRIVEGAGFRDVHSVFQGPGLINAWGFSHEWNFRKIDVAHKGGYESREGLARAVHRLGVMGVSEMALLSSDEIVARSLETALGRGS